MIFKDDVAAPEVVVRVIEKNIAYFFYAFNSQLGLPQIFCHCCVL